MKIALTSCADPKDAPIQPVWQQIATHHPDHLLLLGDQIYMDYGGFSKNFKLGEPADDSKVSDQRFAHEMHERYEAQWNIMRKSGLFDSVNMKIHGIWDDHDFGSNNACGIGAVGDPLFLSKVKQRISRRLFRDFFNSLKATSYPANPFPNGVPDLVEQMDKPLFHSSTIPFADWPALGEVSIGDHVSLFLLDGRSFRRTDKGAMIGAAQMSQLQATMRTGRINLVASGVTLEGAKESWDQYGAENSQLLALANQSNMKVLMLAGDIHNTDFRSKRKPFEVIASGAARPFGNAFRPDSGNFGIIDVNNAPDQITIDLFEALDHRRFETTINAQTWSATGKVRFAPTLMESY